MSHVKISNATMYKPTIFPCEISGLCRDMVEVSVPWDVARHKLAFVYRRFGTISAPFYKQFKQFKKFLESWTVEDGTDMSQNVSNRLPNYTAQHGRRAKAFLFFKKLVRKLLLIGEYFV
jgi:hypothetical protein